MTAKEEDWGPWIVHHGAGCPVASGTIVEVVCEDRFGYRMNRIGQVDGASYSSWNWEFFPELKKIVRYRAKRPKALLLLKQALRDVPYESPIEVAR